LSFLSPAISTRISSFHTTTNSHIQTNQTKLPTNAQWCHMGFSRKNLKSGGDTEPQLPPWDYSNRLYTPSAVERRLTIHRLWAAWTGVVCSLVLWAVWAIIRFFLSQDSSKQRHHEICMLFLTGVVVLYGFWMLYGRRCDTRHLQVGGLLGAVPAIIAFISLLLPAFCQQTSPFRQLMRCRGQPCKRTVGDSGSSQTASPVDPRIQLPLQLLELARPDLLTTIASLWAYWYCTRYARDLHVHNTRRFFLDTYGQKEPTQTH